MYLNALNVFLKEKLVNTIEKYYSSFEELKIIILKIKIK